MPVRSLISVDLPAPFTPDQRNAISALYRELNVAENFLFAIALRHARAFDDQSAAGFGLWKTEVDGLLVRGDLDAGDFLEFLDAALHLLRLGRLRAKAVDKGCLLYTSDAADEED